ncbi:hypothetical protein Tco_1291579 [Tanacetum coccineum]
MKKKVTMKDPGKEGGDQILIMRKWDDNVQTASNNLIWYDGNNTNNVNSVSLTVNAAGIEITVVGAKTSIELPYDPNMPELEDIFYSDDDEDVGSYGYHIWALQKVQIHAHEFENMMLMKFQMSFMGELHILLEDYKYVTLMLACSNDQPKSNVTSHALNTDSDYSGEPKLWIGSPNWRLSIHLGVRFDFMAAAREARSVVANSTTEAEYVVCFKLLWSSVLDSKSIADSMGLYL